ncbi:MAG TPA: hypothetical protein PKE20_08395, partial [Promineifilum sp.]|nr:hypothetical protein [Promineifilum sp.]
MKKEKCFRPSLVVRRSFLVALLGLLALPVACGRNQEPPTPTPGPTVEPSPAPGSNEPTRGQAVVNSIDVLILESFPVQVNVVAQGDLPDSCTQIDEIISQLTGDTFRVAITTLRQPGEICTQVLVPFEQSIPLDVAGLPAGDYSVLVNGVSGSFNLSVDNVLEEEAATTGAGAGNAAPPGISGLVWHDVCSQTGTATAGATAGEGCVPSPSGDTL